MKLGTYYKKVESQEIMPDESPFDVTIRFYHLTVHNKVNQLDLILGDLKPLCYTERSGTNILL